MDDRTLDKHGRYLYKPGGRLLFASGSAIVRWGQTHGGFAVLHRLNGFLDDKRAFSWHRTRAGAYRELQSLGKGRGPILDERVIPLQRAPRIKSRLRRKVMFRRS